MRTGSEEDGAVLGDTGQKFTFWSFADLKTNTRLLPGGLNA